MENRLLKRLSGLSRSALNKTRKLLGTMNGEAHEPEARVRAPESEPENTAATQTKAAKNTADKPAQEAAQAPRRPRKTGTARKPAHRGKSSRPAVSLPVDRNGQSPLIVPAGEHSVTRKSIGRSALKVLDKLHEAGHAAYLVGGGVRDALVGLKPKDFDVATDASPETIRALFRNSRIIGRRFRLVHVVYGREIIEVATFRAAHDKGAGGEIGAAGRIVRDNVFGSIEEDAYRRDFSVNALYYNIADGSVVDYVGGLKDLKRGVFQLIGDPVTRCEEDPVRVLRAVRLAAKLKFSIDESTLQAMRATANELCQTPPPRLFEEVLKLFQGGYALRSFHSVRDHDLLQYLFPMLDKRLKKGDEPLVSMLDAALENTDRRVAQGKPITPSYLLAFMLWPDVQERALLDCEEGVPVSAALLDAGDSVLSTQLRVISIPRRFSGPMKEIWQMQPRLERYRNNRALGLIEERRFRAAYDFLCLRATVDQRLKSTADWWTQVQALAEEERVEAAESRPVADDIWPNQRPSGKRGKPAARSASAKPAADSADRPASSTPKPNDSADASATGKPPRKRRRRRRKKPNGDKGSAGSSTPPAV